MPPKKTAAKDDQAQQQIADQPTSQGKVAIFHEARLPYHPAIEERFQVNKGQWKVLVEAIFPAAKSVDSIVMALSYCQSRSLDIMKRPVHIVPMWDSARGSYVETVWPGISELRTTASRTKGYAGVDEADFGPIKKQQFKGRKRNGRDGWTDLDVTVEFPEWCRITVYRMVDGQRCKFVGPKVKWLETYATIGNSDVPNQMWQERPEGQLEKCAEAGALRRAFPEELGNELTAEEMTGRNVHDIITTVEAAGEPAGAPPASPPPTSGAAGQRDAAPPRRVAAADPISTGPIKADPPAEPSKKDAAPPRQAASAPARPLDETVPHQVSGNGHTFESWTEKYCDLLKTSKDTGDVYAWIDKNAVPLQRLEKGRPSEFQKCRKAAELLIEGFRAAAQKADAKQPAIGHDMEDPDEIGDMFGDEQPQWPSDPEAQLKHIERLLAAATADTLEAIWDMHIRDHYEGMFPPDQSEAMAIYRKHEARIAP